jgi:hypothetical protein
MHLRNQKEVWASFGGLGPDLGKDEIVRRKEMNGKVRFLVDKWRLTNKKHVLSSGYSGKSMNDVPKPPTNRDRAIAFAKSISRPPLKPRNVICKNVTARFTESPEDIRIKELVAQFNELSLEISAIRSRYNIA